MIAALLALLFSFAAHLSPVPATVTPAAPAVPSVIASLDAPPAPAIPSWDDRANPPASPEGWAPATDSPMCAEDLGIVSDCWTV